MSEEFKAITTQAEFDAAIKDRIARAEEAAKKPYADYDELKKKSESYEKTIGDLNKKIKDFESAKSENGTKVQELEQKIKDYETTAVKIRIAHEVGVPYDLAGRLTGESEDDIRKDAETLVKYMTKPNEAPLGDVEPTITANDADAALMKVVNDLER